MAVRFFGFRVVALLEVRAAARGGHKWHRSFRVGAVCAMVVVPVWGQDS